MVDCAVVASVGSGCGVLVSLSTAVISVLIQQILLVFAALFVGLNGIMYRMPVCIVSHPR